MKAVSSFSRVRPPAVAGMFYPDDADELRRMVGDLLDGEVSATGETNKAYILPHAGYIYSGVVAGSGYRHLRAERGSVSRVVLLGPSHRVAFSGLAFSSHEAFATPLGVVPVDSKAVKDCGRLAQLVELDQAHRDEHSLEVHLPFLQMALGDFQLVPLVVGHSTETEVAEVLERLWGGRETRVIISSDLSHYHDYESACALDQGTASRIESLEAVVPNQACGAILINGLLCVARRRGLKLRRLDLRNSGDTAGPRDRVVGYGAFALGQKGSPVG